MIFMFENLNVYKKAIDFVDNLYSLCDNLKQSSLSKIADQLRRASLSIPLNIAEGCGRFHNKERKQFYKVSRGSLHECVPLLEMLLRRKQLSKEEFINLYNNADQIGMMLNGLIRSVDNYVNRKADSRKAENPISV
ncbi:hypothetical protein AMJ44_08920 [candidate division WOR-1 bacterium DG_54_3]|uniref:Four helix bundle protein n=1 Tax=candidate division WOR-1 bacterium DG_54_3 TaxID=1703775 RepID=A0A0S7XUE5_UNCSA|nr:MAG: hypothetical protein AMJ44_08920 [candidate division WOR-1 bacterium DG_54_3]